MIPSVCLFTNVYRINQEHKLKPKIILEDLFKLFIACTSWRIPGNVGTMLLTAIPHESLNRFKALSKSQHFYINKGSEVEKDGNCGKFIVSNLVICCYKEFENFALCESVSQLEATFIVYSKPIESGHVKISFSKN